MWSFESWKPVYIELGALGHVIVFLESTLFIFLNVDYEPIMKFMNIEI